MILRVFSNLNDSVVLYMEITVLSFRVAVAWKTESQLFDVGGVCLLVAITVSLLKHTFQHYDSFFLDKSTYWLNSTHIYLTDDTIDIF